MTRPIKGLWLFLLSLFGMYGGAASAASALVLCADDIKGESVRKGAEGCIDVLAWSWGLSVPQSTSGGGGSGRPNLQDFSLTKYIDSSSDDLFSAAVTGQPVNGVEFRAYTQCVGGCSAPFLTISMSGARVSSILTGGSSAAGRGTENVTLVFDEISYCYRDLLKGGTPQCHTYAPGPTN